MKKTILIAFLISLYAFASAQDMPGMKMPMPEKNKKVQKKKTPVKAAKKTAEMKNIKMPGSTIKKDSTMKGMNMPMKDTSKKMGNMQMPKDTSKGNTMDMSNMKMDNMDMPKANLGPIKTITNNIPPRTVRYDLYVRDTIVNFTGKKKRAIAVNGQIPILHLLLPKAIRQKYGCIMN